MFMNGNSKGSDDYFGDGMQGEKHESETDQGGEARGLLPKDLMAGKDFKVGDEIMLKITAIHEKDFEVEYAPEKSDEDNSAQPPTEGEGQPNESDMASMMY